MSPWVALRRLIAPARRPVPAGRPSVPTAPPPPAPATPATSSAAVAELNPPDSAHSRLRADFARSVRQLDDELTRVERTPQVMTLLGQLAGDPEGHLRQPPAAAQRAMAACRREDATAASLVALFENDPTLAQAVLARANSAYYTLNGPRCLSLADAVTRQGRRSVHNVLLQQTLGGLIYWPGGSWNEMVSRVWSHMVRTGPLARALGPLFDVDGEQAFALALLHDVGKLVVFDRIASLRTAHRGEFDLPAPAVARVLRRLHEPLGGLCALGWDLGDDAARAIASHHRDPAPAGPDPLTEVIWLAERTDLAARRGGPIDLAAFWPTPGLGADPDAIQEVLDEFYAQPDSTWA